MYLLYTLVNFRSKYYMAIFKVFLQALIAFSDVTKFELCIVCDDKTHPIIEKLKEINRFPHVSYIRVPVDKTLHSALFRKFDVFQHPNYMSFEKILFLDCDIIVQDNIIKLFQSVKTRPNKLYVPQEGTVDGKYWNINAYLPQNIDHMKKQHIQSFNAGTFLFTPTETMRDHFIKAKEFGMEYKGKHFYDQSIFNYYFNRLRIASISSYITKKLVMFPDTNHYYPDKMLMHISGIGRYKEKGPVMKKYLELIKKSKGI